MDIFVPPSLNSADAALNLSESLAKLLDPKERAKIADDIKAHHALNDTEAKKSAEAKAMIKQHSDILTETQRILEQNQINQDNLEKSKKEFDVYCENEKSKISSEWEKVKDASEAAKNLHNKAESMINDVASREDSLRITKEEYAKNVKKLNDDNLALEEKRKGIEKFQQEVLALDNATKTKVEKLKQFNF